MLHFLSRSLPFPVLYPKLPSLVNSITRPVKNTHVQDLFVTLSASPYPTGPDLQPPRPTPLLLTSFTHRGLSAGFRNTDCINEFSLWMHTNPPFRCEYLPFTVHATLFCRTDEASNLSHTQTYISASYARLDRCKRCRHTDAWHIVQVQSSLSCFGLRLEKMVWQHNRLMQKK